MNKQAKERFSFINMLSHWRGYVRNKDLQNQFGISRQQAYTDLKNFLNTYPGILVKENTGEYWINYEYSQENDIPVLDQYLEWLSNGHFYLDSSVKMTYQAELIELPFRTVSRQIISVLSQAVEQKKRIELGYVSLTHPEFDGRIFHPHTFVRTAQRWHIRGYCEKSQGYRDLVLSRCRGNAELLDASLHDKENDIAWNTNVTIILSPDPRLTQHQQDVLIHDYNMKGGQLVINTRAALVNYVLKNMQVSIKYLDGIPEAQQLVLVNRSDIRSWLFDG